MSEEKKGFFKEFKEFAMKGNVVDMAVGVIIGGAFGKIVTSLVDNVIMPAVGMLLGGVNFSELAVTLPSIHEGADPVSLNYGMFIQNIIDFILIALVIFIIVKLINKSRRKAEAEAAAEPAPEPEPTKEEVLLTEIRDLLKEKK